MKRVELKPRSRRRRRRKPLNKTDINWSLFSLSVCTVSAIDLFNSCVCVFLYLCWLLRAYPQYYNAQKREVLNVREEEIIISILWNNSNKKKKKREGFGSEKFIFCGNGDVS